MEEGPFEDEKGEEEEGWAKMLRIVEGRRFFVEEDDVAEPDTGTGEGFELVEWLETDELGEKDTEEAEVKE